MNIRRIGLAVILVGAILLVPAASRAGNLGIGIIGLFPKDIGEFAYADLKKARQLKWFPQLKEQMLPSRFRQFEQFLAAAGVDPNTQVDELAWALMATHKSKPGDDSHDSPGVTGEQIVGVALGQFSPNAAEEFFKAQKLVTRKVRGYTLFAFGSGVGPSDLFFFFIDSNPAALGHREPLANLIDVRFRAEAGLLRNDQRFPLVTRTNARRDVQMPRYPACTPLAT